jgi:hypothetical protein
MLPIEPTVRLRAENLDLGCPLRGPCVAVSRYAIGVHTLYYRVLPWCVLSVRMPGKGAAAAQKHVLGQSVPVRCRPQFQVIEPTLSPDLKLSFVTASTKPWESYLKSPASMSPCWKTQRKFPEFLSDSRRQDCVGCTPTNHSRRGYSILPARHRRCTAMVPRPFCACKKKSPGKATI